jgi:hypothetical protein
MSNFSSLARNAMVTALLVSLTGCGGGGGSDNPPQGSNPPPPAPAPAPPPAPPPAAPTPPISATVQDLSAGDPIGASRWGDPRTDGSPIAGYNCVVNPPDTIAYYSHVTILVNNEPQRIPARVGASPSGQTHCFYPIHTDDASGRIHIESATTGTFTLGQLFQIWGQPLTNTNVAGVSGLPVEVFVTDGTTVTQIPDTDWAAIELTDHREITIGLGTPVAEIPNYTWTD